MKSISIVDYECGNVFSLKNAINKYNPNVSITYDKDKLIESDIIFLPGVGSFPAAMKDLNQKGIDENFFKDLVSKNKTLVGICLGFQLLFSYSNEFHKTKGLNLIKGEINSIFELSKIKTKKTNMWWLDVKANKYTVFFKDLDGKYFFFAHSYCLKDFKTIDNMEILKSKFLDVEFISCIKNKNIIGFQFHPEKSGKFGLECIKRIVI